MQKKQKPTFTLILIFFADSMNSSYLILFLLTTVHLFATCTFAFQESNTSVGGCKKKRFFKFYFKGGEPKLKSLRILTFLINCIN